MRFALILALTAVPFISGAFAAGTDSPFADRSECGSTASNRGQKNSFCAAAGLRLQAIRDPLLSVMAYSGAAPEYGLQWRYSGEKFFHWFSAGYSQGTLTSSITERGASKPTANYEESIGGVFNYGLVRYVRRRAAVRMYCGASWDTYIAYKTHYYDKFVSYSGDIFSSLGPVFAALAGPFRRHGLSLRLSLPLVNYVIGRTYVAVKPPDKLLDNDLSIGSIAASGDWLTLNTFFAIRGEIGYRLRITDIFSLSMEWDSRYFNYSKLPRVKSIVTAVSLGTAVSF